MRKILLIFCLFIVSSALFSLEFTVSNFREDAFDHVNDVGKQVLDNNADACAVLRVETDIPEELYLLSPKVYKKESKVGYYYLYVSHRKRLFKFGAKGYMPKEKKTNIPLQKGVTYVVKIKASDGIVGSIPVTILSEPADADKIINGKNMGNGKTFKLRKGTYKLKLAKEGYKTLEREIEVNANNTLFENFTLEQVELVSVQISSSPSDAEVFINGQSKGQTPLGIWLYPSEHELKISKSTYLDVVRNLRISETQENNFSYNLTKNRSYLNLQTTPIDAIVKLNGVEHPEKNIEVAPGEYTLNISKSGYISKTEKVYLKLGETLNKIYNLKENVGYLNLTITPSDAKVFINKEDKGSQKSFKLAPATYQVRVEKQGYYPHSEVISLKLDERVNKKINLQGKTGTLLFNIKPLDAKVSLYKDEKLVQTWQGMKQIKDLLEGEYKIVAKADKHKSYSKTIQIREKQTNNFKAVMEKGADGLFINSLGMEFVLVEAGTFQMGSTSGDSDEKPVHQVTLTKDYYLGKYEVTQAQWVAVMGSNPSDFKGDNLPVEQVSWNMIQEFITKLNQKEGGDKYRLPTEAEWEFAARGGNKSQGYTYAGSNTIGDVAWYSSNSSSQTHQVGTKKANELGIYDMSGNVWEWCSDWWGTYSSESQTDPTGPSTDSNRVLRGGSWYSSGNKCRVAFRIYDDPSNHYCSCGFRILVHK